LRSIREIRLQAPRAHQHLGLKMQW
jgi:hypothetical protein